VSVPAIDITDLSLRLPDGSQLFNRLDLRIEAGLCTCILGPSGCGKSTLLRLISGSTALAYSGSIKFIADRPVQSPCAWMGQEDLLLPWMGLLDNVLLGPRLRGELSAALRSKAETLIAAAGLSGYESALPATLSGGMRQRAALLRTLMEQRPVLLMDEPFSALDALTRLKLQELASELSRSATVLLVTHDAIEALRMAHRVIVLGKSPAIVRADIVLSGSVPRRPDHPEVTSHYGPLMAGLLETVP